MRSFLLVGCIGAQILFTTTVENKAVSSGDVQGQGQSLRTVRMVSRSSGKPIVTGDKQSSAIECIPMGSDTRSVSASSVGTSWSYPVPLLPALCTAESLPLTVAVLTSISAYGDSGYTPPRVSWTMINVCPGLGQADCHLLEFPDGTHALIDAAEGWDGQGVALDYLKKAGITHLELVVLSHVHWDHYGKLIDIINSGIKVDRVALSLPASREIADVEIPWGCNWDDVQALLQFLRKQQIPYWIPYAGEKLVDVTQKGVSSVLEVVCCYDGITSPVGRTDVNDTSMLVRLRHGTIKALFTGDLNTRLGEWLAKSSFDLQADLLKVPHHGTDGLAPNSFFDRVAPKVAFVPSPKELWYSLRSKRSREYFKSHEIPTYVSGVDGTVKVTISPDKFEIATSTTP